MKAFKIFLSIFFVTIAGLLFWQGFDPLFEGLDAGLSFLYVLMRHILMILANIIGALFCLFYALMPWINNSNDNIEDVQGIECA